jgi:phosphate acetyltransferase
LANSAFENSQGSEVVTRKSDKYEQLLALVSALPALPTAVVHPCDESSLHGLVEAAALGLIAPVLVGPAARIKALARKSGLDIASFEIVDTPHSHASAAEAVRLVRAGRVECLMKGSLHSDELLGAVVAREGGLRTARRISHCFVIDVPTHPDVLIVSDAAVNIAPTLADKVDIVQNAIDLALALGIPEVRVAILSALETVNPKVPSTIEAAALCKMADRGQITGGILDGPLALDNDQPAGRGDQAHQFASCRPRQRTDCARHGKRQHPDEEPHVPCRGRSCRHRTRCPRASRAHQPGRSCHVATRVLRGRRAGRTRQACTAFEGGQLNSGTSIRDG